MAKVVTLFIDDTNIRLLVARGKRVQKWARLLLEPGLVRDGVILDEAQMADKLKELFKLEKITATRVIAGISGLNSLYRLITLPELPEAVKAEAIRHEAGRVIPVSLSQVYYSYQPLPSPKGETRFFLAAFPRNAADALIRTLRQVGVEPYLMDLAPLALCRTVNEPRAIIINANITSLDIVIMADRVPEVIRSLSPPGEATSLSEALPAITEELERTIAFYNSSHQEKPLDSTVPMFVCGDLAESPESWQPLAGKSNYSVSILPPIMEFPEGFNPHQFMVNIGLALKELPIEKGKTNFFSIVNFNALPDVYLPKAPQVGRVLIPIAVAIIGIGLISYMWFLFQGTTAQTNDLRDQLAATEPLIATQQMEIAKLKKQIANVEPHIMTEATAEVFEATYTSFEQGRERIDADLSKIAQLVPYTVDLLEINHEGDSATISGIAPSEDDVFGYARELRGSGQFSSVVILSIQEDIVIINEGEEEEEEIIRYGFVFLIK